LLVLPPRTFALLAIAPLFARVAILRSAAWEKRTEHGNLAQWFSNFCPCQPISLHPKPLRTPSFCQHFSIVEKLDLVAS